MNLVLSKGKMISSRQMLVAGLGTGLMAGLGMISLLMIRSWFLGTGLWFPAKMIASMLLGLSAYVGGLPTVLIGLAIHFLISIFWGGIYGIFAGRIVQPLWSILASLFFGILVWWVTFYFILPFVGSEMLARVRLDQNWWLYGHLFYGSFFISIPALERSLAPQAVLKPQRLLS